MTRLICHLCRELTHPFAHKHNCSRAGQAGRTESIVRVKRTQSKPRGGCGARERESTIRMDNPSAYPLGSPDGVVGTIRAGSDLLDANETALAFVGSTEQSGCGHLDRLPGGVAVNGPRACRAEADRRCVGVFHELKISNQSVRDTNEDRER